MSKTIEIRIAPSRINSKDAILIKCARKAGIKVSSIVDFIIIRKSIDSRGSSPVFILRIRLFFSVRKGVPVTPFRLHKIKSKKTVVIVGAGPAGYFAAMTCIDHNVKPVVIERGKEVRGRRRDLRNIQQKGVVDCDSNYCFGEGGAGTYSDGKLYTRANKRGNVQRILEILVRHGASSDILIDSHPHIGSNKLPGIIQNIRESILSNGGEVHFNQRVSDFIVSNQSIEGVRSTEGTEYKGDAVILCTGHSARDIYEICKKHEVGMEFKPFALGVRIEHRQCHIDEIQYGQRNREENLPASSYRLACQTEGLAVFSFCMCPGGLIVPTATAPGELVVNGMSLSRRDSPFANAGTVVSIDSNPSPGNSMGGIELQSRIEQKFFNAGDGSQKAAGQRLTDFVNGKMSSDLLQTSYIPGVFPARFDELLPPWINDALIKAIWIFDRKMKGYYTEEAQVIGVESRTSAPVRILRNKTTFMSEDIQNLFPCGEGAGYAGGILSAAMDGENVARSICKLFMK